MKNILNYYYHFIVDEIRQVNKKYFFTDHQYQYIFMPFLRSLEEVNALYYLNVELSHTHLPFHRILLNKDRQMLTFVNDTPYVLLQVVLRENRKVSLVDFKEAIPFWGTNTKTVESIVRFDWVHLWTTKLDYLEYQIQHLQKKYLALTDSLSYFIGLGENAISYVQNTLFEVKREEKDTLVISHRRVSVEDDLMEFYHPMSLILDHRVRDISEYLKSLFYHDHYQIEELDAYFQELSLSPFGYRLLYGRLLFPSFYFDLYDQIINGYEKEERLFGMIGRIGEYERFLYDIYNILKKYTPLPPVTWIQKKFSI